MLFLFFMAYTMKKNLYCLSEQNEIRLCAKTLVEHLNTASPSVRKEFDALYFGM